MNWSLCSSVLGFKEPAYIFIFTFFRMLFGAHLVFLLPLSRQLCFMDTTGRHLNLPCFVVSFCQPSILPSLPMVLNPVGFIQILALPGSKTDMPPVALWICVSDHPQLRWQLEGCHPHPWCVSQLPAVTSVASLCCTGMWAFAKLICARQSKLDTDHLMHKPYRVVAVLLFRF